jgi:hypothetical protein
MNQTGHGSVQMVRRYIRDGSVCRENSARQIGIVGKNLIPAAEGIDTLRLVY